MSKWIIEKFPDHLHYVETHFGGGGVFFRKPDELIDNHSEVINDVYGELMNFWRVLQDVDAFDKFERIVSAVPFSEVEWRDSFNEIPDDKVSRAVRFFIRFRQSWLGKGDCFRTILANKLGNRRNLCVSNWIASIEGLPDAHDRLYRVAILDSDAIKVIKQQDGPHTLFYCDPPYLQGARVLKNAYVHEMTESQHMDLLEALEDVIGMFVLSGYRSKLYDDWAIKNGFQRLELEVVALSSAAKVKPRRTECLWINYELGT